MLKEPIQIRPGSFNIQKAISDGADFRLPSMGGPGLEFYKQIEIIAEGGDLNQDDMFFEKALDASTATGGAELVPTIYNAKIIKYVYEANWARQRFATWPMRSIDEKVPKIDSDFEIDYHSTPYAGDTSTDFLREDTPTTTEITLSLKTLTARMIFDNKLYSYNVQRANLLNVYREMISKKIAAVEEDVLINGDTTTGTSNINYTYDETNHRHGYDTTHNEWLITMNGLRKTATATDTDAGGNAYTLADIITQIKNIGIYGLNNSDLVLIVSPDVALTIIGWEEVETLDKYGPGATIFHGEVGRIKAYGISIQKTDKVPCTMSGSLTDSTGARSATVGNNSYTETILVYNETVMLGVPVYAERLLNISLIDAKVRGRKELVGEEDFAIGYAYEAGIARCFHILPPS